MLVKALGTTSNHGAAVTTSSLLLDETALINCSGSGNLSMSELVRIDTILLSNSSPEQCRYLVPFAQAHAQHQGNGFTIYAQQETLNALHETMFNDGVSPDYTKILGANGNPVLRFQAIEAGETLPLPGGIATPLPAEHEIPTIGWLVEGEWRALALPGGGEPCRSFWQWISSTPSLTDIVCDLAPYFDASPQETDQICQNFLEKLQPFLPLLPPNSQMWLHSTRGKTDDILFEKIRAHLSNSFIRAEILRPDSVMEL